PGRRTLAEIDPQDSGAASWLPADRARIPPDYRRLPARAPLGGSLGRRGCHRAHSGDSGKRVGPGAKEELLICPARTPRNGVTIMKGSPLQEIRCGIVVSCQAGPESPLNAPHFIVALAQSAERGGAVGFRVDRPENIAAVRAVSDLPIL